MCLLLRKKYQRAKAREKVSTKTKKREKKIVKEKRSDQKRST